MVLASCACFSVSADPSKIGVSVLSLEKEGGEKANWNVLGVVDTPSAFTKISTPSPFSCHVPD